MPLFTPTPILTNGALQSDGTLVFTVPNPCAGDLRPGYTGDDAVFGVNDIAQAVAAAPGSTGGYWAATPIKDKGVVTYNPGGKSKGQKFAFPYAE